MSISAYEIDLELKKVDDERRKLCALGGKKFEPLSPEIARTFVHRLSDEYAQAKRAKEKRSGCQSLFEQIMERVLNDLGVHIRERRSAYKQLAGGIFVRRKNARQQCGVSDAPATTRSIPADGCQLRLIY